MVEGGGGRPRWRALCWRPFAPPGRERWGLGTASEARGLRTARWGPRAARLERAHVDKISDVPVGHPPFTACAVGRPRSAYGSYQCVPNGSCRRWHPRRSRVALVQQGRRHRNDRHRHRDGRRCDGPRPQRPAAARRRAARLSTGDSRRWTAPGGPGRRLPAAGARQARPPPPSHRAARLRLRPLPVPPHPQRGMTGRWATRRWRRPAEVSLPADPPLPHAMHRHGARRRHVSRRRQWWAVAPAAASVGGVPTRPRSGRARRQGKKRSAP